jgi:thymidylate kinase
MPAIISMMGIDGSGKSTLARALAEELRARNEKAIVQWATIRPVLLKPVIKLAKFLLVRKHNKYDDYKQHIKVKRAGMKKLSWARGVLFFFIILEYLPQVLYKVWWKRLLGYHVICDRYYFDLVVDYGEHVNAGIPRVLQLISRVRWLFPKPDLMYFVAVTPEVAYSRKDDIPAIEYLHERDAAYSAVTERFGVTRLDGSKPVAINSGLILADLVKTGKLRELTD